MPAYIVRVGNDYVRYALADRNLIILTKDKDEAGWYTERGAHIVMDMVRDLYPGREPEVTH